MKNEMDGMRSVVCQIPKKKPRGEGESIRLPESVRLAIAASHFEKPIRCFRQYDGLDADMMGGDEDGDWLCSTIAFDPQRTGAAVRVRVLADADKETVLRRLKKIIDWIEKDGWGSEERIEEARSKRERITVKGIEVNDRNCVVHIEEVT